MKLHDPTLLGVLETLWPNRVPPCLMLPFVWPQGVQTIKGRDFQSYLRNMPHSEFPSGTSCICVAYAEYYERDVGAQGADFNFG